MISTYWEGDIPLLPLLVGLQDEYNARFSLTDYDIEPVMLDSDNRRVDLRGYQLVNQWETGVFQFYFPTDRVILNKHGDYMLQFLLTSPEGREQRTAAHTIRVRALGKRGRK